LERRFCGTKGWLQPYSTLFAETLRSRNTHTVLGNKKSIFVMCVTALTQSSDGRGLSCSLHGRTKLRIGRAFSGFRDARRATVHHIIICREGAALVQRSSDGPVFSTLG
jgi:hypothetical protein